MAKQKLSAKERRRRSYQARINFGLPGANTSQFEDVITPQRSEPAAPSVPPPGFGGTNRSSPPSGAVLPGLRRIGKALGIIPGSMGSYYMLGPGSGGMYSQEK